MTTIKIKQITAGDGFIYVLTDRETIIKFEQGDFKPNAEKIITKDTETKEIKVEDAPEPAMPEAAIM